jgi:Mn2+/Fe2+ NRAMP family transporter
MAKPARLPERRNSGSSISRAHETSPHCDQVGQTTARADAAPSPDQPKRHSGLVRTIGLGLITGAADDDPVAIGTYASAGAKFGPSFLWTAPVAFPMMIAVVYLSSKLGLVSGEGLFTLLRKNYSRALVFAILTGVLIGNLIEAGADIGGMAAALNMVVPVPIRWMAVAIGALILILQVWGSYTLIRNVFRGLSVALLAYVGSAMLAHPQLGAVLRGTLLPVIHFNKEFLAMIVAVIGSSLSAYLFTWQSNQEVEEKIAAGRKRVDDRKGASHVELERSRWDVIFGMLSSSAVIYFIMLSTASTLFRSGKNEINTAAEAAQALTPLAGHAAGVLFAIGIIAVGALAVPVMTAGAAYDLCQTTGWKNGLSRRPREAKQFYAAICVFTLIAVVFNFMGINPMKALVFGGIVQGFSTPPLMLLIMRMTNNPAIVGNRVNGRALNALGWATTAATFAAAAALVITWFL